MQKQSFSRDQKPDRKPRQGGDKFIRISDVLPIADIGEISDGEFNLDYLKSYSHVAELEECIENALLDVGHYPYQGRRSCALVMGRAMELLRDCYCLDAPRGWVPVMRCLRSTDGDGYGPATQRLEQLQADMNSRSPD